MIDERSTDEMRDIVSQRINALIMELEKLDWGAEQVVDTISDLLRVEWASRFRALEEARQATPKNFVSDGNEG
jgi:hypothetical protein